MNRVEEISIAAYRSSLAEDVVDLAGGAAALRAPQAPESPMLNRIVALGVREPATEDQLDAAMGAMTGLRYYVTISPAAGPAELTDWLTARGFEPGWGWMQFARDVGEVWAPPTSLDLVEIGPERADVFAAVVRTAFGLPAALDAVTARTVTAEGWTCWIAYDGDEPAGAAALFVEDGDAYLGLGGTLPEHRGKGSQSALLATRIARARELGCRAVYTETGEQRPDRPSGSYRNIVRAGFEELYVVPNWISPSR